MKLCKKSNAPPRKVHVSSDPRQCVLRRLCHNLRQMSLTALFLQCKHRTCCVLDCTQAFGNLAHGLCPRPSITVSWHDCLPVHSFHISLVVCKVARPHGPDRFLKVTVNMGSIRHIAFHLLFLCCVHVNRAYERLPYTHVGFQNSAPYTALLNNYLQNICLLRNHVSWGDNGS